MNIKDKLLAAADQSPGWRNICTDAFNHIEAQERRIAELEAKMNQAPFGYAVLARGEITSEYRVFNSIWCDNEFAQEHIKDSIQNLIDVCDPADRDFVSVPVFTAPPTPANAIDAERYRFLRKLENDKNPQQYDDVVDAAILKGKQNGME